jgi:DinB superfamily
MSEIDRIVDELTRAVDTDPWHGSPVARLLDGIDATRAAAKPRGNAHSIWEIVRHMTAWAGEVRRRIAGHPASEPEEGDWPTPSGNDEQAWRRDVALLFDVHQRLLSQVRTLKDEVLFQPATDARDREAGAGVTHYVLLHGLSQHHAYHAGQIAILKKMVCDQTARPPS